MRPSPPPSSPGPPWWALTADEVLRRLGARQGGLDSAEAARRLLASGPNRIGARERRSALRIALHQFASPLIYVLVAAMLVSLSIGHWEDSIVIGFVLLVNSAIGFFQEHRAERSIAALLGLLSPRALVRRDGRRMEIDSRDLVPGDVALLASGAAVPADLRLLEASRLQIDEAPLTGESLPAVKSTAPVPGADVPVADRDCMAFMGTSVASGRGVGVVAATGASTEIGRIASEITLTERAPTPLQERMKRFGRLVTAVILVVCAAALLIGLARGVAPGEMYLTAVAIAVSAIPEGLPVVMTVALAVSVRRMAKRHVIMRRLPAIETLGSCTVIVTDKTGTLTRGRMTVQSIRAGGRRYEVTGGDEGLSGHVLLEGRPVEVEPGSHAALHQALLAGLLCNEADLRLSGEGDLILQGDPTDAALLVAAAKAGLDRDALLGLHPQIGAVPFESHRAFAATVHASPEGRTVLVKGAVERVLPMCTAQLGAEGPVPLDRDAVLAEAHRMGREGLRVLAMAAGPGGEHRGELSDELPRGLTLAGLVGMLDPPRPEVERAIAACRDAGIRVIMVTGDHESTAVAIAERIGLTGPDPPAVGGARLEAMGDEELLEALRGASVFARVSPGDKLRIVNLLRSAGHVVAVTGDGVNDGPALKSAHIGAAMGRSGTDVAKEASEMVLADDNFATVYAAVEEGRTAFANVRNATLFLVSAGVAELVSILGSLVSGLPLPFRPAQILWLNVVTDGIADLALAFEPGEPEQRRRPPRPPAEGILSARLLERSAVVGLVMAAGTLGLFVWELRRGADLAYAQVAALTTMAMFQVVHVGNCRSEHRSVFAKSPFSNPFLFWGVLGSWLVHVLALYLPATQRLLGLEPLRVDTWLVIGATALSVIVAGEAHKRLRRNSGERPGRPAGDSNP